MQRRELLTRACTLGAVSVGATAPAAARRLQQPGLPEPCSRRQRRRLRRRDPDAIETHFEITDVEMGVADRREFPSVTFRGQSSVTVEGSVVPEGCEEPVLDFVDFSSATGALMVATAEESPTDGPTYCVPEPQRFSYRVDVTVPGYTVDEVVLVHECRELRTVVR